MKTSSLLYLMVLCLVFWSIQGQAQTSAWTNAFLERQVMANSSGYFEGKNFYISWTVGEPVSETLVNDKLVLTQGFEQPDLFTRSTVGIKNVQPAAFGLMIYPNPATSTLTIQLEHPDVKLLNLQLFDSTGKLLHNWKIGTGSSTLEVHTLPPGLYLLRSLEPHTLESTTIKLQKI